MKKPIDGMELGKVLCEMFGRCTGRSMTACSNTSPCVLPAEYNSQRGRGSDLLCADATCARDAPQSSRVD